jgi:hypothetical protein
MAGLSVNALLIEELPQDRKYSLLDQSLHVHQSAETMASAAMRINGYSRWRCRVKRGPWSCSAVSARPGPTPASVSPATDPLETTSCAHPAEHRYPLQQSELLSVPARAVAPGRQPDDPAPRCRQGATCRHAGSESDAALSIRFLELPTKSRRRWWRGRCWGELLGGMPPHLPRTAPPCRPRLRRSSRRGEGP